MILFVYFLVSVSAGVIGYSSLALLEKKALCEEAFVLSIASIFQVLGWILLRFLS